MPGENCTRTVESDDRLQKVYNVIFDVVVVKTVFFSSCFNARSIQTIQYHLIARYLNALHTHTPLKLQNNRWLQHFNRLFALSYHFRLFERVLFIHDIKNLSNRLHWNCLKLFQPSAFCSLFGNGAIFSISRKQTLMFTFVLNESL